MFVLRRSGGGSDARRRKRDSGLFGKHHRDSDFRAKVEQVLANDILAPAEEQHLPDWAQALGITADDWGKKFRDLLDRM